MRGFILKQVVISVIFGLTAVVSADGGQTQDNPPPSQTTPEPQTLSDQELGSFVKAYVQTQRLREEYEHSLERVQDPKDKERVQEEAAIKLGSILREQGLDVESYNRAFATVNTNPELRRKALALIEEERKRS